MNTLKTTKSKTAPYYLAYTLVFAVCAWIMFGSYYYAGKSMIWGTDGVLQAYPYLSYVREFWQDFFKNLLAGHLSFPLWDLRIGEGSGVLSLLGSGTGYLFDPLYIISAAIPAGFLETYITITMVVKFYIAGIGFSKYASCMGWGRRAELAGTIVYVFSAYAILQTSQLMLLWPVILCPFVFLGLEKAMRERKIGWLVCSVAYLGMSSFYALFVISIWAVFYCIARYFDCHKGEPRKTFIKTAGFVASRYVLGVALSAVILLPAAFIFLLSSRMNAGYDIVDSLMHYGASYYKNLFAGLVNSDWADYYTYIWVNAVAVVAVVLVFLRKETPRYLKWMLGISAVILLVPILGKIMNGMGYVANRWSYMFGFFAAAAVSSLYPYLKKIRLRDAIAVAVYLVLSYLLCRNTVVSTQIMMAVLMLVVLCVVSWKAAHCKQDQPKAWVADSAIIGCIVLSLTSMINMQTGDSYVEVGKTEQTIADGSISSNSAAIVDDSVYRIAYPLTNDSHTMQKEMANQSLMQDYFGTQSYFSLSEGERTQFYEEMELPTLWSSFNLYGFDDRTILNTLSSVKYYLVEYGDESYQPYEYSPYLSNDEGEIYVNDNFLQLGFVYDSYISYEEFEKMTVTEREEAMMQAAVLEEVPESVSEATDLNLESYQVEYNVTSMEDMAYEDGIVTMDKNGASLYFTLDEDVGETVRKLAE